MTKPFAPRFVTLALALVLLSLPLLAADERTLAPSERRALLRPTYEAVQQDATFHELRAELDRDFNNPKVVERYLQYLPISPLEMLEIDMWTNRYEYMVPRHIVEWHARWVVMHQDLSRDLYGDAYVDSKVAGWPVDTSDQAADAPLTKMATVGTNRNAAATTSPGPERYQGEIQVAVNPNNPNQIVAAANTWDTIGGTCAGGIQAVFYSSDGGTTWGYTCPPDQTAYAGFGSCAGTVFGSDPALAWNDNNEIFLNHMMICSAGSTLYAMVVARSSDGGATWSAQGVIKNSWGTGTLEDKNFYVVDTNTGSPFYGRHYTCWDRSNNEKMAYSTNNGVSWTEVDLPTPPGGGFDLGCDLAVEDNGTVHIVWNTLTCGASCTNERMFYTRSTNGGVSWSSPNLVRDFNLVGFSNANCPDAQDQRCIGPFGGIAVDNSGGACDGTLYATFSDFTSGGVNATDVWVSNSTNNGTTWSAPVLVNDDGLANRVQFHPFVQVDQSNGSAVVGWHDARNDTGNDAIDYFVARSTNCGVGFEANIQVSQPSSEFNNSGISFSNANSADNPNVNPNQFGEYIGVDAMDGKAYLAWSDTRHYFPSFTTESQDENLGFAIVDFGAVGGPVCGNNTIETGEVCDGTDLGGETCVSQGFAGGGTLACNSGCSGFDTSGCSAGGGGTEIWMSFRSNTAVPGVGTVRDEDIVSYDETAGTWALEFDGSDVGLGSLEISGMAIHGSGDLLLSFTAAGTVGGIAVDDSDIVRFAPTSLGPTTAGSFSLYFDGSDVALTANGEDVDSIALSRTGDLIISSLGRFTGTGASGADEDLFLFTGTLGSATSGSFSQIFDGSDVALNNSSSEDIDAATLTAAGNLLFSTVGNFSVAGASGADEDVAEFSGTFGSATSGSFSLRLDLTALGIISSEDIGSLHIVE